MSVQAFVVGVAKWACIWGLCWLAVLPSAGLAQSSGKKYALLVGVETYDPAFFNRLRFAEEDVQALGQALQDLGFDVIVMTSQAPIPARKPNNAQKIMAQLEARCQRLGTNDTLIVALSGHGVMFEKQPKLPDGTRESYFCPEEADLNDLDSLVSVSSVMATIESCPAERKLLIVDACRNEAESELFKSSKSKENDLGTVGLAPRTIPKGMLAVFSCAEKEKSIEDPELQHGVFSYHLLRYLRGDASVYPRDQVSLFEMASYARRETSDYVFRKLNQDQSPVLISPAGISDWPLGPALKATLTNSIGMKLRRIPAGQFVMGNEASVDQLLAAFPYAKSYWFEDASFSHTVRITQAFYLGQFEVTVGQFGEFVRDARFQTEAEQDGKGGYGLDADGKWLQKPEFNWRNPGFPQADDHPVVNVSWKDARAFCDWLSRKEGRVYRLPTEAQWEYACRAGTRTHYYSGDDPESVAGVGNVADGTALEKYSSWTTIKSRDGYVYTAPAGSYRPNAFGLCDMHGNVWEWCHDWYDADYYQGSPTTDPAGPLSGSFRVLRGGGWSLIAAFCRSANRSWNSPGYRCSYLGFRVALVPSE